MGFWLLRLFTNCYLNSFVTSTVMETSTTVVQSLSPNVSNSTFFGENDERGEIWNSKLGKRKLRVSSSSSMCLKKYLKSILVIFISISIQKLVLLLVFMRPIKIYRLRSNKSTKLIFKYKFDWICFVNKGKKWHLAFYKLQHTMFYKSDFKKKKHQNFTP